MMNRFLGCALLTAAMAVAQVQPDPSAISIFPSGTGVPTNAPVLIRYCCNVQGSPMQLQMRPSDGGRAPIAGRTQLGATWLMFTPDAPLRPNTGYSISFSSFKVEEHGSGCAIVSHYDVEFLVAIHIHECNRVRRFRFGSESHGFSKGPLADVAASLKWPLPSFR